MAGALVVFVMFIFDVLLVQGSANYGQRAKVKFNPDLLLSFRHVCVDILMGVKVCAHVPMHSCGGQRPISGDLHN